ncbi:MAG: sigma-54-dependent Fis family transcriptional regulator [Candidatus Neomarinimicrobiota bacterium]|nr:MAG: sigma-54-dependent Fis family transcriptional regulator [Candidatus Neomarinimicrobiota bacterium]
MAPKILIIDDDPAIRTSLKLLLKRENYTVLSATNPSEALTQLSHLDSGLILMDMNYSRATSGKEGLALLEKIRRQNPEIPIILMTAWASIQLAVEGMKLGASDFISKPWNNEQLLKTIATNLTLTEKHREVDSGNTREELDRRYNFEKIIGNSPQLLKVLSTVGRVSQTDASVLILGESGTGKELIAEAIHVNSLRQNKPFVKVNLGGIPSSLFETEMFGHKKGAFTDAKSDRVGRFEMADNGTIFLDEIGDLPLNNQVKLLRVLQEGSFEKIGAVATQTVNVRLISATNRDLKQMVEKGHFREDLFYRINLITITLPPLRERREDIPLLVQHFINNLKMLYKRPELFVKKEALSWLKSLSWTGNIRELKNLVERVVLMARNDTLTIGDFRNQMQTMPRKTGDAPLPPVGSMTLEDMEKSMIIKALKFHGNNISKVAGTLGLSRAALYRRLEKYNLTDEAAI